jgi:hypothetical protein
MPAWGSGARGACGAAHAYRVPPWVSLGAGLALGVLGCAEARDIEAICRDANSAPRLTLRDSIVLEESESVYLGNPGVLLAFGDDGRVYIPDFASNRALSFDRDGRLATTLGRPGAGPGEFRSIGFVTLVVGDTVLHSDYVLRRISAFDTRGNPLGQARYEGRLTWLHPSGDTIWLGLSDRGARRGIAQVRFQDLVDPEVGEEGPPLRAGLVSLPPEYDQYRVLGWWDDLKPVVWADTMLVAFGGVEYLVRYRLDGTPLDTIQVPVCRRHGSPSEVLDRWFRTPPRTSEEQEEFSRNGESRISALLGLWRFADGRVMVWYQDARMDPGRILRGTAYLSVLTPDLQWACVDAELAAPASGRSRVGVHRGDVFLLDQVVDESGVVPRVQSVLRRYALDTSRCRWLATGGLRAEG